MSHIRLLAANTDIEPEDEVRKVQDIAHNALLLLPCPCCTERDEAIRTRTLAQAASTRDLEAKRAMEEKLRLALRIADELVQRGKR